MMNERIEAKWKYIKGTFKMRYKELTDDDVYLENGKLNDLLIRLHNKTGKTIYDLREEIINW